MTGAAIMQWYLDTYKKRGIIPLLAEKPDMGHTIHKGAKVDAKRLLITPENTSLLGGSLYAVEPAGYREKKSKDGIVVARFEECVSIPKVGASYRLGSKELVPLSL
jgi:hypothetical protein